MTSLKYQYETISNLKIDMDKTFESVSPHGKMNTYIKIMVR